MMDQVADRGVTFGNAFVTTPLCAPSRASLLSGQYAHHHGVLTQVAPWGGATKFHDASTLASWLHDAGYRTGLYGKYINDYEQQCPPTTATCYVPPGWDEWHAMIGQGYYGYSMVDNGTITTYGTAPSDYSTDVLAAKAVDFIASAAGQPFFLYVAFHAPHQEKNFDPIPAPRHEHMYDGIALWRPPSWDEDDISDKPSWYALLPRADDPLGLLTYGSWGDYVRQRQLETLAAVDEAVDAMLRAVDATGDADNTIVVFTSDNGYLWGEHRYFFGKTIPQEESLRVPLVIRYPRLGTTPYVETHVALNIDLAPTLARLAGLVPPTNVDGVSLVPLLRHLASSWRDEFVVEAWTPLSSPNPNYTGIRTPQWKYVSYPSASETELYDLSADPFELDSRAHDPAAAGTAAQLRSELDQLLAH
jgi:N-acetylglucosamine-6-sulfatase